MNQVYGIYDNLISTICNVNCRWLSFILLGGGGQETIGMRETNRSIITFTFLIISIFFIIADHNKIISDEKILRCIKTLTILLTVVTDWLSRQGVQHCISAYLIFSCFV